MFPRSWVQCDGPLDLLLLPEFKPNKGPCQELLATRGWVSCRDKWGEYKCINQMHLLYFPIIFRSGCRHTEDRTRSMNHGSCLGHCIFIRVPEASWSSTQICLHVPTTATRQSGAKTGLSRSVENDYSWLCLRSLLKSDFSLKVCRRSDTRATFRKVVVLKWGDPSQPQGSFSPKYRSVLSTVLPVIEKCTKPTQIQNPRNKPIW